MKLPHPFRARGPRALLALGLILAGCAGPAPTPGGLAVPEGAFRHAEGEPFRAEGPWWRDWGDPALTALVERALGDNLDVRAALARVRQAQAGWAAQASRQGPTVDAQGTVSDQRSGLPEAVKRGQPDVRALRLGLDSSWELDLFGGVRAAVQAAELDAQAAALGVDGARLLVAGETARHYLLWRGAREQLALLDALHERLREAEGLQARRLAAGEGSALALRRAEDERLALDAQRPPLRTLIAASEARLAVLSGRSPSEALPELAGAGRQQLERPRPGPGLPSELLRRRPDVQAAERQWRAAGARRAEAEAQRWPRLFLSALFGGQDLTLNGAALAPVRFSSAALAFRLPVFDGGRTRAGIERAGAREAEAEHALQAAVLRALEEVETALVARGQDGQQRDLAEATLASRQAQRGHAQALWQAGQTGRLPLLEAERGVLAAELALSAARHREAQTTVQLMLALGGGWSLPPQATR